MLAPVSVGLKFGFLAVLYLFLLWVAWSALRDLRRAPGSAAPDRAQPEDATGMHAAADRLVDSPDGFEPRLVVERAPGHESGVAYDLAGGATLGRGDVEIRLDDPFASSHHARLTRQGHVVVIEDLGSTNGTYLNEQPLTGPQPLHPGDRIRIGDSEFSYLQ
ncbi:MAG: FHA domain-containing protein [Solirubrobacterales bacterium]|nr:MAG: FHA domain-containing protein [Solirubrobacterales bacterium]